MRIALLVRTIPTNGVGGPPLSMWALAQGLKDEGHEIWILPFASQIPRASELIDELLGSGIQVEARAMEIAEQCAATPDRSFGAIAKRIANLEKRFYPLKSAEDEVKELLGGLQPDLVIAYETAVATALQNLSSPLVTCLVDLDHLPQEIRLKAFDRRFAKISARGRLRVASRSWLLKQVMLRVLRRSDLVINFAAHHAAWLRDRGVECRYLQTPIPDYASLSKSGKRKTKGHRILLLGHLRGTATLTGLHFLAKEVLPHLAPRLPAESCEIRVAGSHEDSLPRELKDSLEAFGVRFLGFVRNIGEEIESATVILVPTPIDLGTRVRILVGFSHGRCVIAHVANTRGIPELRDRINCLVGRSGPELAALTLEALSDSHLRRTLEESARKTYRDHFAPAVVSRKFCALVEPAITSRTEVLKMVGDQS